MQIKNYTWGDGTSDNSVKITMDPSVVQHLFCQRQNRFWKKEAGGQLFGQWSEDGDFVISYATGPRPTDKRSKFGYVPDRKAEQAEISTFRENGIWYLGDWHTHPESHPQPSDSDLLTMNDCFNKSVHGMGGFLIVIVGTSKNVGSWYVGITGKVGTRRYLP